MLGEIRMVEGRPINKQTGKPVSIDPTKQGPVVKLEMLGDLAVNRTFEYDGGEYKKIAKTNTDGMVAVLRVTGKAGRPAKPMLPHWAIVKV